MSQIDTNKEAPSEHVEPEAHAPRRLRRLGFGLTLLGVSGLVALLLLEGVIRIALPQKLVLLRSDVWAPHDGLGWRHSPNLDVPVNTGEGEIRLRTDADGFRIGADTPAAPARRVLALGDSFLAALQVEYPDILTSQLERTLTADLGESVRIVNAGVGGWGPSQYLLLAQEELARHAYDLALVFVFMPNDIERERLTHIPPREPAPRHTLHVPRAFTAAAWIDAFAYPINDALETRSHLFTLFKKRGELLLMRVGLTAKYLPEPLMRSVADDPGWEVTADILADIARTAAAHDTPTLVVLLPGVYQVDDRIVQQYTRAFGIDPAAVDVEQPSRLLLPALTARGVTVIDTTPALRAAHAAGQTDLYGRVDTHFAPAGHAVVAEHLAPFVRAALTPPAESS